MIIINISYNVIEKYNEARSDIDIRDIINKKLLNIIMLMEEVDDWSEDNEGNMND